MTEYLPYIAGFVTLLFGYAFYLGLKELKDVNEDLPKPHLDEK